MVFTYMFHPVRQFRITFLYYFKMLAVIGMMLLIQTVLTAHWDTHGKKNESLERFFCCFGVRLCQMSSSAFCHFLPAQGGGFLWSEELEGGPRWWFRAAARGGREDLACGISTLPRATFNTLNSALGGGVWVHRIAHLNRLMIEKGHKSFPKSQFGIGPSRYWCTDLCPANDAELIGWGTYALELLTLGYGHWISFILKNWILYSYHKNQCSCEMNRDYLALSYFGVWDTKLGPLSSLQICNFKRVFFVCFESVRAVKL